MKILCPNVLAFAFDEICEAEHCRLVPMRARQGETFNPRTHFLACYAYFPHLSDFNNVPTPWQECKAGYTHEECASIRFAAYIFGTKESNKFAYRHAMLDAAIPTTIWGLNSLTPLIQASGRTLEMPKVPTEFFKLLRDYYPQNEFPQRGGRSSGMPEVPIEAFRKLMSWYPQEVFLRLLMDYYSYGRGEQLRARWDERLQPKAADLKIQALVDEAMLSGRTTGESSEGTADESTEGTADYGTETSWTLKRLRSQTPPLQVPKEILTKMAVHAQPLPSTSTGSPSASAAAE